ncbi:MAG TPA: UDP-N-acetylglucosamine 2-epimerase (non-hydrolyzing) [Mycobacteriales bacterium]|nr:UDP-N-acetylglucosamine 2-epimerase (non-hydrolyzing) [Mycobacteriales bacterium]
MVVFGTRPEAVKLAPIILALDESAHFAPFVAVTAQHREMLDQVNGLFGIMPDADLDIMRPRQSLAGITTRALAGLDELVAKVRPDALVVQGDTTTTFVGGLAAHYHRVPVVHVEAGLRTFDRYSPFPEEMNRRLTSQLASLHLAPTPASRTNLVAEGIDRGSVVVTGNSVIDALLWTVGKRIAYDDPALERLDDDPRRVLLVTAHRRESWGEPMAGVGRAVSRLARQDPDLLVVLPVHRNPAVREALLPPLAGLPNIVITEPLGYGGFARLIDRAHLVLTDSGGVQEEAPSLGKPVLVMRDNTERPEAVTAGTARLVGTDEGRIVNEVTRLLHDGAAYRAMANAVNPYGDGRAATRSVQALDHLFGLGPAASEFDPENLLQITKAAR